MSQQSTDNVKGGTHIVKEDIQGQCQMGQSKDSANMDYRHSWSSPNPPTREKGKSFLFPGKPPPPRASILYKRNKIRLLSLLFSVVPTIAGTTGIFSRLQHVLNTADDRCVILTPQVHNDLNLRQIFLTTLVSRLTHFRDIIQQLRPRMGGID